MFRTIVFPFIGTRLENMPSMFLSLADAFSKITIKIVGDFAIRKITGHFHATKLR